MPADVLEVTKKFMRNPVRILVKKEQLTLEGIKQFYIGVEKEVWHTERLGENSYSEDIMQFFLKYIIFSS